MTNTKSIPTDKKGNVYHGPTTYAQAEKLIDEGRENGREDAAESVAEMMEDAGFVGIAKRIRDDYGIDNKNEPQYMNPHTGSVDTRDGWGEDFAASLTEVVWNKKDECWEEA